MTNGIVIGLSALAGVWMGWFAVPICLTLLAIIRIVEWNPKSGVFLACLIFTILGGYRSVEPPSISTSPGLGASTGATGTIVSFPRASGNGDRALYSVTELCIGSQCVPTHTLVMVYIPHQVPPIAKSQVLQLTWRMQPLQELDPGYRGYVAAHGAEGSARATSVVVIEQGATVYQLIASGNQFLTNRIQELIPGDVGALATGVVTGNDAALSDTAEGNFRTTGTSHLTAVSGQNVSIIVGFLSLWFRPARPFTRVLFHLVLVTTVWSFTVFVGMESPAMRAAIVATLTIVGSHLGRKPDPVTLLSLTLGTLALINPWIVHSVGFWLSAVSSMALCLTLPNEVHKSDTSALIRIAAGPAVASIATMPIVLSTFGAWSPMGILTNILVAPIMTIAFPAAYAFALLALIAPGAAEYLTLIPGIPLEIVLVIVNQMALVAMQIRIDSISQEMLLLLWIPIIVGIWLISGESERWLRRILRRLQRQ